MMDLRLPVMMIDDLFGVGNFRVFHIKSLHSLAFLPSPTASHFASLRRTSARIPACAKPTMGADDWIDEHCFQCFCLFCEVCIDSSTADTPKTWGCFRCLEDMADCVRSCCCPGSIRSRAQARALARARADARSRPAAHPHTRHHNSDHDHEDTAPLVSSPPDRVHMSLPSPSPSPPPRTTTESELPPPPAYTPRLSLSPAESHPTSGSVSEPDNRPPPLPSTSTSGRASEPVQASAPSAKNSGNLLGS
ncbi:hypothetical protein R3P38DRAFT_3298637 [Favolaschia claudopus]|uniref:Uncharacterized protein n=1 Tax=Favolaschia claudopus TaxID=2862362 RepID=A0AAV9Z2H3_9AGAR